MGDERLKKKDNYEGRLENITSRLSDRIMNKGDINENKENNSCNVVKEKRTKKRKTKPKDSKTITGEMENENDNESSDERHKKIKTRETEINGRTKQEWTKVETRKEKRKIMSGTKSTSEEETSDLTDMVIESDLENNKTSNRNTKESTNSAENMSSSSNSVSVTSQREEDINQKLYEKEIYMNNNGRLVKVEKAGATKVLKQKKSLYDKHDRGLYEVILSLEREHMNTRKDKNHIKIWKATIDKNIEPKELYMNSHGSARAIYEDLYIANKCLEVFKENAEGGQLVNAKIGLKTELYQGVIRDW